MLARNVQASVALARGAYRFRGSPPSASASASAWASAIRIRIGHADGDADADGNTWDPHRGDFGRTRGRTGWPPFQVSTPATRVLTGFGGPTVGVGVSVSVGAGYG